MLWTDPDRTTIDGAVLSGVRAVAVSHAAERVVVEYSDAGRHPAFVDAAGVRSTFTIRRVPVEPGALPVRVGDRVELVVYAGVTSSPSTYRRVSADVVVTKDAWKPDARTGHEHVIECVAVSVNGAQDPVTVGVVQGVA